MNPFSVAIPERSGVGEIEMLSTCSPQRDTAMMIHLTSPSQTAQFDHHPIVEEIRRTLSRSPSKNPDARHYAFRSSPARGTLPFSPSPLSPSRRTNSENLFPYHAFSSPHSNRANQHSRVQRPTLRRTTQANGITRSKTSPKSPTKRALTELGENCHPTPMLRKRSSTELEKDEIEIDRSTDDKENMIRSNEDNMGWKSVQSRIEKRRSGGFMMADVVPSSPMKRSETAMNIDQPDFASPSSKRRSIHGSSGLDFSIFDSESLQNTLDEKRSQDDNDWLRTSSPLSQGRFSTIPKRSSSLRKSTLQQRQPERFNQSKLNELIGLRSHWANTSSSPNSKKPMRMSLDNHFEPLPRDSPFSAEGKLINASIHPVIFGQIGHTPAPRHPLSRTLTQSSSTPSSAQDDSPTHEPIHRPDRPKSHDFSKSLPVGAFRPEEHSSQNSNEFSSQESFATPAAYKSARPLPAAFMSTGLISKKNRNVDEPDAGLPKAHMPDTPCKRQSIVFDPIDQERPNLMFKPRQSFGAPATPGDVNFGILRATPLPWARNTSIFGTRTNKPSLVRKGSFASIESEEKFSHQSPIGRDASQSTDNEYPPTPTKHTDLETYTPAPASPSPHHRQSNTLTHTYPGSSRISRFSSSKLSPIKASPESMDGDSDSIIEGSPSAVLKPKSLLKIIAKPSLSFTQGRALRNLNSPTPLSRRALDTHVAPSPLLIRTKTNSSPDSPHLDNGDNFSPRTPSEGFLPPDPSGLSISGRGERPGTRPGSSHLSYVPATPTGPREYFGNFSNRPSLNLNATDIADVDQTLTSRFDKVDLVGTGEFSQVYRVTKPPEVSPFSKAFGALSSRMPSLPDRVWAVKKSRYPYSGPKDRLRKVHEVDALKAMGQSEHILSFVDSWEDQRYLYIQTEFCEEGTLDVFLAQAGLKARLDDFRIWKILLEMSLVS